MRIRHSGRSNSSSGLQARRPRGEPVHVGTEHRARRGPAWRRRSSVAGDQNPIGLRRAFNRRGAERKAGVVELQPARRIHEVGEAQPSVIRESRSWRRRPSLSPQDDVAGCLVDACWRPCPSKKRFRNAFHERACDRFEPSPDATWVGVRPADGTQPTSYGHLASAAPGTAGTPRGLSSTDFSNSGVAGR